MDLDRLRQIVVGALLHRLDRALDGPLRGQQQRRHVGGALLGQRAQQCEPIHARHHQVRDDDGGAEGGDLLERLFAVASRLRDEAPAPDELFQPDARSCIVLNDEHTLGRALLFCGHNTVAVHCGCHSTPQPCHFYILGGEPCRCKLICRNDCDLGGGGSFAVASFGGPMRLLIIATLGAGLAASNAYAIHAPAKPHRTAHVRTRGVAPNTSRAIATFSGSASASFRERDRTRMPALSHSPQRLR